MRESPDGKIPKGSGKVRARNNEVIKPLIPKIVHQFKPSDDLNIIITSASGGSGAVYAQHLLNHFLEKNKPVIVFVVSSTSSVIEVENSIKTLKSFQQSASRFRTPVVISHWQNDRITTEAEVDDGILALTDRIRVLYSGENRKLDNEDLINFLNYTAVTNRQAKLVYLHIYDETQEVPAAENGKGVDNIDIITVASLAKEGMDTTFILPVEYQTVGFVREETITMREPMHLCVADGLAVNALRSLENQLNQFKSAIGERRQDDTIYTDDAGQGEDIYL